MIPEKVINHIIKTRGYTSYLEIGAHEGHTFNNIECSDKECIDPIIYFNGVTHNMTSDEFFETNSKKYDIIFVDGFHLDEQVSRDINNSLKHLSRDGVVICHDCIPPYIEWTTKFYCGDGFKSIVRKSREDNNLNMKLINCDVGFCLIDTKYPEYRDILDESVGMDYVSYMENFSRIFVTWTYEQFLNDFKP